MSETPALSKLLDAMEGMPIRAALPNEQKHIYCDACTEPVYPNDPAWILLVDRIVWPDELDDQYEYVFNAGVRFGGFRLQSVSHAECEFALPYACQGYTELMLEASWDRDFQLSRPNVVRVSSRNAGLEWDPIRAFDSVESVLNDPHGGFHGFMRDNDIEFSPHEIVMSWIASGIDPRWVIDPDSGEIVAGFNAARIREAFTEEMQDLREKWREQPPPFVRFDGPIQDVQDQLDQPDVTPDDINEETNNE